MESSPKTHVQTTNINGDNDQDAQDGSYVAQLLTAAALPMVLHAAVQLEVFEIIAKAGPGAQLSPSEIASRLPTKNPAAASMVDRMLRLLASFSVLTCSVVDSDGTGKNVERLYGLAPVGKYFVRDEDGGSLGPALALLQDKVFIDSWFQLKDSVLEGGVPFDRVHGCHAFEYPAKDPRFNEVFNQAMISHSSIAVKRILECYKGFEHLKTLVDVGGGLGTALNKITSKYPTIKGINFDLPHVIKHAPAYPGVEHVGGDMFESVPKADAIYMKSILHDWSDEHCIKLLKNCYKALPVDGKVIVVETILPVKPDSSAFAISSSQLDLLMMTQNPGGKERSEHEFLALAKEAGFKGITLECFVFNLWVMEFYK